MRSEKVMKRLLLENTAVNVSLAGAAEKFLEWR